MTRPTITMNIDIRVLQKVQDKQPQDVQISDVVHFVMPDFSDCVAVMLRFSALAEEIRREQLAAEVKS